MRLSLTHLCHHLQQVKEMLISLQFPSFAFIKAFNTQSVACTQVHLTRFVFLGLHFLVVGHDILQKETNIKVIKRQQQRQPSAQHLCLSFLWHKKGNANLQSDPVLYQQTNLNVHQVQVFLHLLIGANIGDHFLPKPRHLLLFLKVQGALLQQVNKLAHH